MLFRMFYRKWMIFTLKENQLKNIEITKSDHFRNSKSNFYNNNIVV